ncbi:MAG: transcriptional regulator [Phycisphaerae bacterium]|jgi:integration host factor subunit beta|nr:transcriptional regulator [Phycisphaerae bacterium]|tara:strand:+ start:4478 stop:4858 length:381 start_codon:yes stop_codon:yes gene_type:complete
MPTITKKVLIDRIAENTNYKKAVVGKVVNSLFDHIVEELGKGNRIELRNFGVFEIRTREPRMAQNPKTLEPVRVDKKKVVKFKVGRLMKNAVEAIQVDANEAMNTTEMPVVETTTAAINVEEPVGV